jgi:Ca2+-binding RTX toxin-like protein
MIAIAVPPGTASGSAQPRCAGRPATIVGTNGADLLKGTRASDVIVGLGGADLILGNARADVICGGGGDDEVLGGGGADRIEGGPGDDFIAGGLGDDLEGGGGYQDIFPQTAQARYASTGGPVPVPAVGEITSTLQVDRGSEPSPFYDVNVRVCIVHPRTRQLVLAIVTPGGRHLRLSDHRGNGTPFCAGNRDLGVVFDSDEFTTITHPGKKAFENRFHPEWSLESLDGGDANGTWTLKVTDSTGAAAGTLLGWSLDLTFASAAGNGADSISGEGGTDLVDYTGRTEPLHVTMSRMANDGQRGEGDDIGADLGDVESVYAGTAADTLAGTGEPNELRGGSGGDTLLGLGGDDVLSGGGGNDHVTGGSGDDTVVGNGGADSIRGGTGSDLAAFRSSSSAVVVDLEAGTASGDGSDTLAGVERLSGSNKGDRIAGTDGPNGLFGGGGDDTILGRGGDDTLDGGDGTDRLDGGAGMDICLDGEDLSNCD